MTTAAHHVPAPRRPRSGIAWFAAMVAGWAAFGAALLLSEPTLGELWRWVRDLPFLFETLVWLALFPFVFALGIWDSSWDSWLRLALVACCAVGWSLAFWPRPRRKS